jgi:hypothetical protein
LYKLSIKLIVIICSISCVTISSSGQHYCNDHYGHKLSDGKNHSKEEHHSREEIFPFYKGTVNSSDDRKWPLGIIYYDRDIEHPLRNRILSAMNHISSRTNLCFLEKTHDSQYAIVFDEEPGQSGNTIVGYWSGFFEEHLVTLGTSAPESTIIHELLHVAGLYHEQNREDRDNYITVHFNNIAPGNSSQYEIDPFSDPHGAYDFHSIMHYKTTEYAIANEVAFSLKPTYSNMENVVGSATGMSSGDIAAINFLYPQPAPCIAFVCRGCEVDLEVICTDIDAYQSDNQLYVSQLSIENLGSADALPFTVSYYLSSVSNPNSWLTLGSLNISYVLGQAIIEVPAAQFDISSFTPGNYDMHIIADMTGQSTDIDITNNTCYNYPITIAADNACNASNQEIAGDFFTEFVIFAPDYLIVPRPNTTFTVKAPSGNITLKAGGFVDLNPGFLTESGTVFTADIDDCTSMNRILQSDEQTLEIHRAIVADKSNLEESVHGFYNESEVMMHNINKDIVSEFSISVVPNPFAEYTDIGYTLKGQSEVEINLFDLSGKKIREIQPTTIQDEGNYKIKYSGEDLVQGIYILSVRLDDDIQTQRIVKTTK